MCLRLSNNRHCLSLLSILGFLQTLISLPIIVLSFIVFFETSLGAALSPFWCGIVLLLTGVLAMFIRPTRLALMIFLHVLLNAFSICTCFLSAGITGLYGTAAQMDDFSDLQVNPIGSGGGEGDCIFAEDSPLYSQSFRDAFRPIDSLVDSCEDLEDYWTYLVSIMSLSFMGFLISCIAITANCITPCVEDRYDNEWSPKSNV